MNVQQTADLPTRSTGSRPWLALGLVPLVGFTYLQFVGYVIPGLDEIYGLKLENMSLSQVGLIWAPIIGYLLVSTNVCLTVTMFKPLKAWNERGLVRGLRLGLVGGLSLGLLSARGDGLVWGLGLGFLWGLVVGLLVESINKSPH